MPPVATEAGTALVACLAWPRKAELLASGEFGDDEGRPDELFAPSSLAADELESGASSACRMAIGACSPRHGPRIR